MRLRARLAALFPEEEPHPRTGRRERLATLALSVAAVALLTAVGLRRVAGGAAPRTVWAEDGSRFLAEWHLDGYWATLLRAHAGYGQVGQRALVPIVDLLPIQLTAAYLATLSAAAVVLIGLLVYRASAACLPERWPRVVLAALGTVLPYAAYEASDNVANLQWFVVWGAFWALLWRPPSRAGLVVCTAYLALAVPNAPTAGLLLPVALVRLVAVPGRAARLPALAYLAGLVLQLGIVASASRPTHSSPPGLADQVRTYLVRVVLGSLDGLRGTRAHWARFGWVAVAGAGVVLLGCLVLALADRRLRALAAAAAVFSLAYSAVGERFALAPVTPPTASNAALEGESRYFVVPMLLTLVVAVCGCAAAVRRWPLLGLVVPVAVAVPFVWSVGRDLATVNARTTSVTWAQALDLARAQCAVPQPPRVVWVPVAPNPPMQVRGGFRTPVACDRLR